jgi:hypothetical protein
MDFTAVDSFLFAILLVVKDVLLVEEDIFRAVATRVLLWARHMVLAAVVVVVVVVIVIDNKDQRLVLLQVKDRLEIAQFYSFNVNGNRLSRTFDDSSLLAPVSSLDCQKSKFGG